MFEKRLVVRLLAGLFLLSIWGGSQLSAADEKKEDKKKGGTVVGVLTAKGENFIEVKGDGDEKARRYVPHWRGGAPAQGGGPDKKMLETFKKLEVGSKVRLEWEFEERARVVKIEVVQAPKKDK